MKKSNYWYQRKGSFLISLDKITRVELVALFKSVCFVWKCPTYTYGFSLQGSRRITAAALYSAMPVELCVSLRTVNRNSAFDTHSKDAESVEFWHLWHMFMQKILCLTHIMFSSCPSICRILVTVISHQHLDENFKNLAQIFTWTQGFPMWTL